MKRNLKFKEKNLQESNLVSIVQHLRSIGGNHSPNLPSKKSKSKTNATDDASSKYNKQYGRQLKKRNSASFSKASDGAMNRS